MSDFKTDGNEAAKESIYQLAEMNRGAAFAALTCVRVLRANISGTSLNEKSIPAATGVLSLASILDSTYQDLAELALVIQAMINMVGVPSEGPRADLSPRPSEPTIGEPYATPYRDVR